MKRNIRIALTILSVILFSILIYRKVQRRNLNSELSKALEYYDAGDFGAAKDILVKLSEKHKNNHDVWQFLGTTYMELGNDSLAEQAYTKAIELNHKSAKALTGLGIIHSNREEYKKAEELYRKAIDADPNYGKAYSSLLVIEVVRGNFENAVELGEKATSLDKTDPGIKGNLALAYHYTGSLAKRDSLLLILEKQNYRYLENLKMLVEGKAILDRIKD